MPGENSRLVYSTDGGRVRPAPGVGARKPTAGNARPVPVTDDGFVRVRRETKGRGGKVVTTITGVPGGETELDTLLKVLKQLCGAGGSREGRVLQIQGDHRAPVLARLEALGHRVKLAGG